MSGTYVGRVALIEEFNGLEVTLGKVKLDEDGDLVPDEGSETWPIRDYSLVARFLTEVQVGDEIEMEVEFNNYTVIRYAFVELDPRQLLARIQRIEEHLGLK